MNIQQDYKSEFGCGKVLGTLPSQIKGSFRGRHEATN